MNPREQLVHARSQADAIGVTERMHMEAHPYRLVHEHDMRAGQYRVRAHVREPMPAPLLGAIEDALRTLRASLDVLASAIAGVPARFPIHEALPVFAQRSRKHLRPMPDEAQAIIEEVQPYHAIGGFRNGPLWVLDQLAGAERPRLAAGTVRDGAELGVNTRRKVDLVGSLVVEPGAFDDGDVIAAVGAKIVGPDPKLDLFLRAEFALAFERRGPARGREVGELLHELVEHVEATVFVPLEPFIATAAP